MAHPSAQSSHAEEERVRHISASRYYIVWIALLVLTAITLFTAKGIHLPSPWGLIAAIAIATGKATLVALFFMHLWDHGGTNRLVMATSIVFLFLLIGLTVLDSATRFPLTNPPNERNMRSMPPGPDILSPIVEPRGGLAPDGPRPPARAPGGEGDKPARPTGSN